jgi:hypothetical protein
MTDVQNPDELLLRGQTAALVGQRDEARELLRRAIELAPDNPRVWLALAGVEDDSREKVKCFETTLKLDPQNVEARLGLEMLQSHAEGTEPAQVEGQDELDAVIAQASRRLETLIPEVKRRGMAAAPAPARDSPPDDDVLFCANHPTVETMLRCNRCGKPICTRCAVRTPVGYRCKACVGQQQAVYYAGGVGDYIIGGIMATVLGGLAGLVMSLLGAWFFALILGPTIGIGIGEAVRLAVRRRRSRYLWISAAAGILVGALPALLLSVAGMNLWRVLTLILFLALAVGAAVARLR